MDFVGFGQSQAGCFPLLPVFMLGWLAAGVSFTYHADTRVVTSCVTVGKKANERSVYVKPKFILLLILLT